MCDSPNAQERLAQHFVKVDGLSGGGIFWKNATLLRRATAPDLDSPEESGLGLGLGLGRMGLSGRERLSLTSCDLHKISRRPLLHIIAHIFAFQPPRLRPCMERIPPPPTFDF